jgi:putative cofactor-binding repeat protein
MHAGNPEHEVESETERPAVVDGNLIDNATGSTARSSDECHRVLRVEDDALLDWLGPLVPASCPGGVDRSII